MTVNDPNNDNDLRDRFAALRREEEAQVPEFAVPLARVPGRGRSGRLVAVVVCAVTLVAAILWVRFVATPDRDGRRVASLSEWKAPTDFLLETPGQELLRTVPAIGEWHDYGEAPGERHEQQHVIPRVTRRESR